MLRTWLRVPLVWMGRWRAALDSTMLVLDYGLSIPKLRPRQSRVLAATAPLAPLSPPSSVFSVPIRDLLPNVAEHVGRDCQIPAAFQTMPSFGWFRIALPYRTSFLTM